MGDLEKLWTEYVRTKSSELRNRLIESYAPLARYVVDRLNLRPSAALDYEDLLSQAVVGLIDAVDRFDPTRGIKFETYAYHRIRGAVMDMLRELDWLPRSVRQKEGELADAYARLQERRGRAPTDGELADELDLSPEELDELARDVAFQATQSLDEVIASEGGDVGTIGDMIADASAPSPQEHTERAAERELLAQAIGVLPDTERTVVSLYYYEGLTLKEIGRVLGVTESRSCQIHGKAMLRLRAHVQSVLGRPPESGRPEARQIPEVAPTPPLAPRIGRAT